MATTSPTASARPGLMALEEALQRLLADVTPVAEVERVPTQSAAGRVLAELITGEKPFIDISAYAPGRFAP